ncbi:hypothetical protein [Herbidospora daliensis]|uniref:hypothetical protein n=1 Tax=Herbidospora daliensis TaxID=295585 RepID=UPI0007855768|nr:hypothetical protein [Herbidospora daliensis]
MTSIIPEIDARSTREVLAAADVGPIVEALLVDHHEIIIRKPRAPFVSRWSVQALNGELRHGEGLDFQAALVACGVDADVAGRVKELAEPSPETVVDRVLAALAEWAVEYPYGHSAQNMLMVAQLAAAGFSPAEAVRLGYEGSFAPEFRAASARTDELIKAAGRAICAREAVEVEDELAAVAS